MKKLLLIIGLLIFQIANIHLHATELIHYWHFNHLTTGPTDSIPADFSLFSGTVSHPVISYPGTGLGYMDDVEGTALNHKTTEFAGSGIRTRNPSDTRELLIELPSTGFKNLKFSYAVQRSNQGMSKQVVAYSVNGIDFTPFGDTIIVNTEWEIITLDFSDVEEANDNELFAISISFFEDNTLLNGNNRFDNIALEGDAIDQARELIYYWHFNELNTTDSDVTFIYTDYNRLENHASSFASLDYTGVGIRDMDEFSEGSLLNPHLEIPPGKAVRVRNPSANRALILNMTTEYCTDIILSYAVQRSGQGMLNNVIEYTTDGINYVQTRLQTSLFSIEEFYQLVIIDFSSISEVNNNPDFKVRITWEGNTTDVNGNNRYDNISLTGKIDNSIGLSPLKRNDFSVSIYPNPSSDKVNLKLNRQIHQGKIVIRDVSGKHLSEVKLNNTDNVLLDVSAYSAGIYYLTVSDLTDGNKQTVLMQVE